MRHLALIAALACAAWGDCSGEWADRADRLPCGVLVRWGPQEPDPEAVCEELARCPWDSDGARIEWTSDPMGPCSFFAPLAGCYVPDYDLIFLLPGPVPDSALCHEMHHRALYLAGESIDYAHRGLGW